MSNDIRWEDPPETALNVRKRTAYTDFTKVLRENPGKWALAPGERKSHESAKNTAQNIQRGVMRDFPKGAFETAVDGSKLYVRFKDPATRPEGEHPEGGNEEIAVGTLQHRAADVRAWARLNGFSDIPERGRLPQHVIHAFEEAQEPEGEPEGESD